MSKVLSVVLAMGVGAVLAAPGNVFADGKATFGAKKCGSCHSTDAAKASDKAPNLSYAGSKYQAAWLEAWLAKPTPVRQVKWGTLTKGTTSHDALSAGEAKEVAAYLATLTDAKVAKGAVPAGEAKGAAKVQGKLLFEKKQGCYGCHLVKGSGGKVTGGFTGPSLAEAGARLQADWIVAYLKDPNHFFPETMSPNYSKRFNDNEMKTIAQYMMSFK
ncbi:MAG: c-type cytochrome [Nitrospirota bacterium]|nr:c-type cytochrome [Nitrospirota bacterium]